MCVDYLPFSVIGFMYVCFFSLRMLFFSLHYFLKQIAFFFFFFFCNHIHGQTRVSYLHRTVRTGSVHLIFRNTILYLSNVANRLK